MKIRPFTELVRADERTTRFTPLGLSMSGVLTPEACAEFQQRAVAGAELIEAVPEGTRHAFERLRGFHTYGVVCYDLFTVTDDLSWIVVGGISPWRWMGRERRRTLVTESCE